MICSKLVSPSPNPHKTYQANPALGMHSTIKTNLLGSTTTIIWEAWEGASQEGTITTTGEEETGFRLATTTPGVPTITLGGTITIIIAGEITTIITGGTLEDGVTITSRSEAWGA